MSFITLGSAGDAPTFFEMVASERLMPSLKAAVIYSLSVCAQRRPGLHRLLERDEELFFLISVLLDRHSLQQWGASFAESLYSLQRVPGAWAAGGIGNSSLSPAQRHTSLILLTLVPYLKAKLDALYLAHATSSTGVLGLALQRAQQPSPIPAPADTSSAALQRFRAVSLRAFLALYPWLNAAHEGARFAYQLFYLLGRSPFYSPELHLVGLVVRRLSGQAAAAADRSRQAQRSARLRRVRAARGPGVLRLLREGAVRAGDAVADNTRGALVLSVFAFKLLEWWYTSAEQKLGGRRALPPPPPPPAPAPARDGVPLPGDKAACPLCTRPRTNPAVIATSGYAFCYPCAYRFVEAHGCCPVTRIPAGVDHIRRLYQGGA